MGVKKVFREYGGVGVGVRVAGEMSGVGLVLVLVLDERKKRKHNICNSRNKRRTSKVKTPFSKNYIPSPSFLSVFFSLYLEDKPVREYVCVDLNEVAQCVAFGGIDWADR